MNYLSSICIRFELLLLAQNSFTRMISYTWLTLVSKSLRHYVSKSEINIDALVLIILIRYLNPNQLSTLIHAMHTTIQFSYTILRQLHSTITDLMTLPHSFASPRLAKAEETATGFEIIRSIGPALGRNVSGRSSHEDRSILRLTSARLNERRVGGERERGGYGAILQLQQTAECSNRFDNDVLNG